MRKLVLSALILASAFQTAFGQTYTSGDWTYYLSGTEAMITAYRGMGGEVAIPSSVDGNPVFGVTGSFSGNIFQNSLSPVTSVIFPDSVRSVSEYAFYNCWNLKSVTFGSGLYGVGRQAFSGTSLNWVIVPTDDLSMHATAFDARCTIITPSLINALANNDAFVTAVANKIKETGGNYGIATQSGLSSAIESLATKTELTSSLAQSRTDGINSVLSNPNLWTLYTTSQIQNMAVGDLVLTRQVSGGFVLNYDIEQSTDLQTWTPYQALSLPLTGLPTDKAFVRIKVRQDGVSNTSSSQTTPTTPTFGGLYNGSSGVSAPGGLNPPNYNGLPSGISPDWLNSLPTGPVGPIEEE